MRKRSVFIVFLILCIWFYISFVTNILGPLIPVIIDNFRLSLTLAGFLPFSFFLAYGVMSIPAGMFTERYGEKTAMLVAFGFTFTGALFFALFPVYRIALVSLFTIGIGMAILQVVINPLMRVAGGEEHFAFNSVLGQLVFGAGSFVSPFVFSYMMQNVPVRPGEGNVLTTTLSSLVPHELPWVSLYWIFVIGGILMFVIMASVHLPRVELKEDEKTGAVRGYLQLLGQKKIILFFLGIFAYVGTEQTLANWMSKFLKTYHGFDPVVQGATAVAWFWGLMSIGCLVGLVILKLVDSKKVLRIFSLLAMADVALALFGPARLSLLAFPAAGFFISVMYSVIVSLALNSVDKHHGTFSGILCTGILGGAVIPLIVGWLGDHLGLRTGMLFVYITLGYILFISVWAKPLINNKTVSLAALFGKKQTG
ncbi:MAG: sugar MFS transporter [Chlorobi bacterium]|nr:sugar MFS transporter [Chlorobiota bacterium]